MELKLNDPVVFVLTKHHEKPVKGIVNSIAPDGIHITVKGDDGYVYSPVPMERVEKIEA